MAESLHAAREHDIDFFLLAITETLQSSFRDWIDSIRGDYRFEIIIWDDLELRREVRSHFSVIADQFSALVKQKNVVNFYEVADSGKSYFCNEVDEVGFYIMNDYGREGNIKWIKEFIAFIRENEISF